MEVNILSYICENNNSDICVSNSDSNEVVIFNQAGNFRFQYPVKPSLQNKKFWPKGVATDSKSLIIIADSKNKYLIKRDGFFAA